MPDAPETAGVRPWARTSACKPSRHFKETAEITPEVRAEGVGKIVGVADRHTLTAAGVFSSGETFEGIFNSRGLSEWHTQTVCGGFDHDAGARIHPDGRRRIRRM